MGFGAAILIALGLGFIFTETLDRPLPEAVRTTTPRRRVLSNPEYTLPPAVPPPPI